MSGVGAGRDRDAPVLGEGMDDGVVHEVRRHLQQERGRADGQGRVAAGLEGGVALFCEGEECFGGLFGDQGKVDVLVRGAAGRTRA